MNPIELSKLINACRNEADLRLSEFQPLAAEMANNPAVQEWWDRARQTDRSIGDALKDVPIPVGLEERIMRGLSVSATAPECSPANADTIEVASPAALEPRESRDLATEGSSFPRPDIVPRRRSRRWMVWAASLSSVAALILILVTTWRPADAMLSDEVDQAAQWMGMLDDSLWRLENAPRANFPLPIVVAGRPGRWQAVKGLRRPLHVVCYEWHTVGGPRALLFVARAKSRAALPLVPPLSSYPAPRNLASRWSMGVWRGGSVVYILAVQGEPSEYQQLIQRRKVPVT